MRLRIFRSSALLLLLIPAVVVPGVSSESEDTATKGQDPSRQLKLLLERVDKRQASIRTLSAEFYEEKESELFVEPIQASGRFYYAAPDRVRWEYEQPDPMSLLVRGDEVLTWYHGLDRARRIEVSQRSQRFLKYLGMGSSLETLLDSFTVSFGMPDGEDQPYRLVLTPRYERLREHLKQLTLWIGHESSLPERIRYVEAGGDVTDYRFTELRVNEGLPEGIFELHLPQDVNVLTLGDVAASR